MTLLFLEVQFGPFWPEWVMARMPRTLVVDAVAVGVYHCVQRCVRRAYLCGQDSLTGKSYEHRRVWIQERLEFLAGQFGLDVLGFAIMSNHMHVVLRTRPDVVAEWSDEEVARRWWMVFPQRREPDGQPAAPRATVLSPLLLDEKKLAEVRKRLSSLSWFMRCLTERIARRANKEDECAGRFFEGRFKAQPLLDESAIAACMAYVDLNPIRAGIAQTPETSRFTSAYERIKARQAQSAQAGSAVMNQTGPQTKKTKPAGQSSKSADARRADWLSPIEVAGSHATEQALEKPQARASHRGCLPFSASEYLKLLDWTGRQLRKDKRGAIPTELAPILERLATTPESWFRLVSSFRLLFRQAAGRTTSLQREATRRGQMWMQGLRHSQELFGTGSAQAGNAP